MCIRDSLSGSCDRVSDRRRVGHLSIDESAAGQRRRSFRTHAGVGAEVGSGGERTVMIRARSVIAALCASATVLACGPGALVPGATEPPRSAGTRADVKSIDVLLGTQLAALRGQNLVSVELAKRHQSAEALLLLKRAKGYAQFPFQDLPGSEGESSFTTLHRTMEIATATLRRGDGIGALTKALAAVGKETLQIESEIVGETSELAAYKASVVNDLAYQATLSYELALSADPFELEPYRVAYGLLREAQNIHTGLSNVVEDQTSDGARAADIMFAAMFGAMPSSEVPADLSPADEVAAAAYMLGELLADEHDAVTPPPGNPPAYMAPLLEEALGAYESGEAGVADVLVEKVRASLCCPSTSAGDALGTELARIADAIRSGAADHDIAALVEEASALAAVAAQN